ncbi:hypothetical protein HOY82DRAFT_579260 [Tuber indicum]|nr:hypothetical protein HOY82DRAFT_579260 [Tuber indicum]
MARKASIAPLVWIDCELYCYITDRELNLLDEEGHKTVVHYEKEVLDNMGDWCIIPRVLESTDIPFHAWNPVHFDHAFLARHCPSVVEHQHCRIIYVSTEKEEVVYREVRWKTFSHDAGMDTLGSIGELRYYGSVIFDGKNREVG